MFQFHSQHFSMFLVIAKNVFKKHWIGSLYIQNKSFVFGCCRLLIYVLLIIFQICEGFFGAFNFTNCFCYKLIKKQTRLQTIFQRLLQKRKNLLQPILHLHLQFFPKIVLDLTLVHWIIHLHLKKRTSTMNPRS